MYQTPFLNIQNELNGLLELSNTRPYVFRTRFDRVLEKLQLISQKEIRTDIEKQCLKIKEKMMYISDQSNQTSDGTLKSFVILKGDIENLLKLVSV